MFSFNINKNGKKRESSITVTIYSIVHSICFCLALYISFKCNNGFNFGSLLVACCCAPFYVIYKLAVPTCQVVVGNTLQEINWME